ncbi:MAG: type I DNA topoisomerase [Candidatus Calescibacterium sp.]|nr:type I DNA topoisomerase [Candidatus Calescibacterium sp.]MCX7733461.1 type I DNA topoisomerase [bacterium]MDW8087442.1 type I DNA topoisomerase [Candidatus Calescibacterium sp.]
MDRKAKFLIVESPTKARKISQFLGKDWRVLATFGHIRDLPQDNMGFSISDLLQGSVNLYFEITKANVVSFLRKNISSDDDVIIASDPDREGEAIAYHTAYVLGLKNPKRAVFHEITKNAVLSAISNPGKINMDLVHAQMSRRVIDRLVGYTISPVLWKFRKNSSAGRVQSTALHLITVRWNEVMNFDKKTYFVAFLDFGDFKAFLYERDKDGKTRIKHFFKESDVQELLQKIKEVFISKFKRGTDLSYPSPPYITSSLLQDAKSILGFSSDFAMKIAQSLFENGYITYHRTDSVSVSSEGYSIARRFFEGSELSDIQNVGRSWRSRVANAQEAHECIRPTSLGLEKFKKLFEKKIQDIKNNKALSPYDKMIYIIGLRFISSQSKNAVYDTVELEFTSPDIDQNLFFRAKVRKLKFDGFLRLWNFRQDTEIDDLAEGESAFKKALSLEFEKNIRIRDSDFPKVSYSKRYTQPPPLYTEATLIKELERLGVGRPSTYANIIKTLKSRGYIIEEKGKLIPTPDGLFQDKILSEKFPDICSPEFTAKMEEELDRISRGEVNWIQSLQNASKTYLEKFELFKKMIEQEIGQLRSHFQNSGHNFEGVEKSKKKFWKNEKRKPKSRKVNKNTNKKQ